MNYQGCTYQNCHFTVLESQNYWDFPIDLLFAIQEIRLCEKMEYRIKCILHNP